MAEQLGPYWNRPVEQRRPLSARQPLFPIGYSAHDQAVWVVTEKARVEVLDAIAHARGCGCGGCYRQAEHTYGWYSNQQRKLKPR
jgi:hypothetical protein